MKKIFFFMAVAATAFAVSCKKDVKPNPNPKPIDNDDPEYVAPITIDGDFADWAKLDASKVATATYQEGASHEALKTLKVYADELYVYIYIDWDKEMVEFNDGEHIPVHLYINGDGDATTGGYGDQWTDACTDLLTEGFLTDGTQFISYEASCFNWTGEANGTGWNWGDLDSAADLFVGAGVNGKYEMAMTRELYPLGKLADTFSIGVDIQQAWESVGVLPEGAEGPVASLQVVTVK